MHLAIVGTGAVGTALGIRLSKHHRIAFGSRDPQSEAARQLDLALGTKADVRLTPDAVAEASVVILATPWPVTEAIVKDLDLAGKIVVDCTNDVGPDFLPESSPVPSCAERLAAWLPESRVVKAFSTAGAGTMADPDYGADACGVRPMMPFCGDDAEAKRVVRGLIEDVGFEPVDAGDLVAARTLEPLALLWIRRAHGGYGSNIAFALLTR